MSTFAEATADKKFERVIEMKWEDYRTLARGDRVVVRILPGEDEAEPGPVREFVGQVFMKYQGRVLVHYGLPRRKIWKKYQELEIWGQ